MTEEQSNPKVRHVKVVRQSDFDAHQYRLQQAEQLLIEAGFVEGEDGNWNLPGRGNS